ncbi:hypothetical protein Tco_0871632, partial [Tanacetum coccineum]
RIPGSSEYLTKDHNLLVHLEVQVQFQVKLVLHQVHQQAGEKSLRFELSHFTLAGFFKGVGLVDFSFTGFDCLAGASLDCLEDTGLGCLAVLLRSLHSKDFIFFAFGDELEISKINMRFSLLPLLNSNAQIGLISEKSLDSLYKFFPHEFSIVNIGTGNNTPKHLKNWISRPIMPRSLACETLVDHRQYCSPRLIQVIHRHS